MKIKLSRHLFFLPFLLLSILFSGTSTAESSPIEQLGGLINSFGLDAGNDEPLHPDEAFVFSHIPPKDDLLELQWQIADEHYLYRNKFKFKLSDAQNLSLGSPTLPAGEIKEDPFFGTLEVYHNTKNIQLPLIRNSRDAASGTLKVMYQGCAERGICYPPITKRVTLNLPALPAETAVTTPSTTESTTSELAAPLTNTTTSNSTTNLSEQDQIAASLGSGNILLTLLSFFGFGLLLAFTPCIFPMIPILSGIIVGQGDQITTRKAFTMSLVYVLAMALTYTAAGVLAGLFGENLQAAFQNPWILGSFSVVFVLLSLSMFGFYDLQMPSSIQGKLASASNRQKGGSLTGVAVMGLLSALIVGPC
ncbi:MAG: protein-disulfide reductase DsbD, partial [Gammaproteobacteria bacterium]|nr:protein-disulfide reductase DsbD [Gammaproteobacteria bacterium]